MATINGIPVEQFLLNGMNYGLPDWWGKIKTKGVSQPGPMYYYNPDINDICIEYSSEWPMNDLKPLPFVERKIAYTSVLPGQSVVSNRFSGCYMAAIYLNNAYYVCHVSKMDANDHCLDFIKQYPICKLFLPSSFIRDIALKTTYQNACRTGLMKKSSYGLTEGYDVNLISDIHALITYEGDCYSFITGQTRITHQWYILSIIKWNIVYDSQSYNKNCITSKYEELNHILIHGLF